MNPCVIEILTEEISIEFFLRELLPGILPKDYSLDVNCFIRPHEGKSHLMKSLPRKMKAYPRYAYPVKVLVLHDQDSNDCKKLKAKLIELCNVSPKIPSLVRIACKELENWYLGDLQAIENLFPDSRASLLAGKAKFRNPDRLNGSAELKELTKKFAKTHAAREMPKRMNMDNNNSISFNHFLSGLQKLLAIA